MADIHDCSRGLLHLEMGTLANATQGAIDSQDKEVVKRHFQFVDEILRDAADVENAVHVSYLEHLRFRGRERPLQHRLGDCCLHVSSVRLADLEAYLARVHGGGKS